MNLDLETEVLYRAQLADFIGERQRLVSMLKKAGRAGEAAAVKTLVKPSKSAWAVNQVYWHARAAFDAVIDAGARLRAAQQARLGGNTDASVVSAVADRDRAIEEAVRAAEEHAATSGERLAGDLRQRVRMTFEALAARPLREQPVAPGRLVEDLGPSGFGALAALMPMAALESTGDSHPASEPRSAAGSRTSRSANEPEPASDRGRPALTLVKTGPPAAALPPASVRERARRAARAAAMAAARDEAVRAEAAANLAEQTAATAAEAAVDAARAVRALEREISELQRAHQAAERARLRADAEAHAAAEAAARARTRQEAAQTALALAETDADLPPEPPRPL